MHIFKYKNQGGMSGAGMNYSQFTRKTLTISNGKATFTRRVYFESDSMLEDAKDIISLAIFPKKYSAYPGWSQYRYTGNATIEPLSETSKIWYADLEYSNDYGTYSGSSGTGEEKTETPPWELGPTEIKFTAPEITQAFTLAYDNQGNQIVPVKNSADDPLSAETTASFLRMSFSYASQSFKAQNVIDYQNSINSGALIVAGYRIPAGCAKLSSMDTSYLTVYNEDSTEIKWQYWNINVTIDIDLTNTFFQAKLLDIGDRATFPAATITAGMDEIINISGAGALQVPAATVAEPICCFRLTKNNQYNNKNHFFSGGDLFFCGWNQYLAIRQDFINRTLQMMNAGTTDSVFELQCQQLQQMPLNNGALFLQAIKGTPQYNGSPYNSLTFNRYPQKSWSALNFPK